MERAVLPHLRAAYNLARWLVRHDHDAEDVVQEALIKAMKAVGTLRGVDARPWLLAIVRNTALNFLRDHPPAREVELTASIEQQADSAPGPEGRLMEQSRKEQVRG